MGKKAKMESTRNVWLQRYGETPNDALTTAGMFMVGEAVVITAPRVGADNVSRVTDMFIHRASGDPVGTIRVTTLPGPIENDMVVGYEFDHDLGGYPVGTYGTIVSRGLKDQTPQSKVDWLLQEHWGLL